MRFRVRTIKFNFRPEKTGSFDDELANYLTQAANEGFTLDHIDYVVDPGGTGYVSEIKAVVITKQTEVPQ